MQTTEREVKEMPSGVLIWTGGRRDLVKEGYAIEPFLAPNLLAVIKPDGKRYVVRPVEFRCDCPATGTCCHLRQWERLVQAQIKEYIRRRKELAKFSGSWDAWQKRAKLIKRLDDAEWELWTVLDNLAGGTFLMPDTFVGYVPYNPELEVVPVIQAERRAAA